jgi:predicted XRE-type DNA-binding protein
MFTCWNALQTAQPDVSKLLRGHFTGTSFERLFGFMIALGDNVKIAVSPAKSKKHARVELELS